MSRFIDLSVAIDNNEHSDHPGGSPKVKYQNHAETANGLAHFFPGLQASDLPDGEGWAVETITLSTHNGTHMDAPWHFHSTTDYGKTRAPSIDETPLEYCFKPGVKLDFRHYEDGYLIGAAEIEAELQRIGHELQPLILSWSILVQALSSASPATSTQAAVWAGKRLCISPNAAYEWSEQMAGHGMRRLIIRLNVGLKILILQ